MKVIQNLPAIFEEFGEQRRKAFLEIKEYKDKNIPVVGMYCAYFPTELAMAVGAIPVGLCSYANETVPAAERDLPKSICPLVKSSYGFAVEDKCPFFHFADLVIGETTCDGKKKMYEMMSEFKPVYVMELPNSQSERGVQFWREEIVRAKEYFEEFFHIVITDQMLRDAAHLNNRIRTALKGLCEVMKLDPAPVTGEDIQKMVQGSKYRFDFSSTPEVVNGVRDQILEEYKQGRHLEKRPRILVTGCPIGGDSMKVIREIEKHGGVVVAIENCSGVRTLGTMVDENAEDIYEAIARKYLSTGCSIMTPNDHRIDLIGKIIDEYHVDGVVEMILTGCHSTGVESFYIRKFVNEEKHLPYLAVETDYSPADTAQISTRMAAFLEMIQPERRERTGVKANFDINCCYKIILEGIVKRKSRREILEEIWKYTGIAINVLDPDNHKVLCAGEQPEAPEKSRICTRDLPEGRGRIEGYLNSDADKDKVEELLDVIVQSYRVDCERAGNVEEQPDFLWILTDDEETADQICRMLDEDQDYFVKVQKEGKKELFISGMNGKEDRDRMIAKLKEWMKDRDGKILIGNGFHTYESKEKNRELQRYVFSIVKRKQERRKVCPVEDYYHDLAVTYIGKRIEKENLYVDELECVEKEDQEKGKDLYETLYWYLKMKRNAAQTAARLRIHRNTLMPRIVQLNDMIGIDDKDGAECERLLMVMEMKKVKKHVNAGNRQEM